MKSRCLYVIMCVIFAQAMSAQRWGVIDSLAESAVRKGSVPGVVVCVVKDDSVAFLRAYGNRQVYPLTNRMTTNTIFDLASVSKAVGTTMAVMKLVEQGKISPSDTVRRYIPDFRDSVTIAHLLTHTSGLPSYLNVKSLQDKYGSPAPDSLLMEICMASHKGKIGGFCYSCLNFVTLQNILQRVTGEPLDVFYHREIAVPLGMKHTAYCPPQEWLLRVAPTENIREGRNTRRLLHGEVHDPMARVLNGGVSGNAGLFSSAEDLARLCIFLMNPEAEVSGSADGKEKHKGPLSPATVRLMTTVPTGFEYAGRTLGWDNSSDYNAPVGHLLSPASYCHSGYTGTSVVIDPERRVAIIILTNRVHPNDKGSVNWLRRQIADVVADIYPLADYPDVTKRRFLCPLPDMPRIQHRSAQIFDRRHRRIKEKGRHH